MWHCQEGGEESHRKDKFIQNDMQRVGVTEEETVKGTSVRKNDDLLKHTHFLKSHSTFLLRIISEVLCDFQTK